MRPVILYRKSNHPSQDLAEIQAAEKAGFVVIQNRGKIEVGDFVVPRYSALPFYRELEQDIKDLGGKMINSHSQHRYIADLQNYLMDLAELTPATWDRIENIPEEGPFILKGETNSRKDRWGSMMFAANKKEAIEVYNRLTEDSLLAAQKIYIRQFEKFKTYAIGLGELPITKEFRFFVAYGKVLAGGFYWSSNLDQVQEVLGTIPDASEVPRKFLDEVIARVGSSVNFYVIDVAQKEDGSWMVVELNDGQHSGTSEVDLDLLYSRLKEEVDAKLV